MNKHESILENVISIKDYSNPVDYFSEAVFKDGKKSIEPYAVQHVVAFHGRHGVIGHLLVGAAAL